MSNPSGETAKGNNGWTQISIDTYAKSSRFDLFMVLYKDTQDYFIFDHHLMEKIILVVDWNYEKSTRIDFERSNDHNGIKFRGKEGYITIHCSKVKSNLIKGNFS